MLLRRSVAVMVASGAAVLALAGPASASPAHGAGADVDRGMSTICKMMMQDRPGMEHVREAMMRNPAMQRMCEMMMRQNPAMAEKCKSMMDGSSSQA
ncbi:hypothetical protein SAMN05216266_13126 [Amycolatopsis marina]|uniref:Uncharacterized protein n=2 Tax=Amycolatopsis marina TaxID=490629 RepID=A0A1I1CIX9_9PSEU|nr:hypothetical protein SAMN05216266_13126 [Amycolatopsis marina]